MEFVLRKWDFDDIKSLVKYASNKRIADNLKNSFPYPYTANDAKWFITSCLGADETKQCYRAISVDGEAVGSIGIFLKSDVFAKCAEIGYWLGEPYWDKGLGTAAIIRMCDYAFSHYDINRIFAQTYFENIPSRKALENAGFVLEGVLKKCIYKNAKFYDGCVYALIREPAEGPVSDTDEYVCMGGNYHAE